MNYIRPGVEGRTAVDIRALEIVITHGAPMVPADVSVS